MHRMFSYTIFFIDAQKVVDDRPPSDQQEGIEVWSEGRGRPIHRQQEAQAFVLWETWCWQDRSTIISFVTSGSSISINIYPIHNYLYRPQLSPYIGLVLKFMPITIFFTVLN